MILRRASLLLLVLAACQKQEATPPSPPSEPPPAAEAAKPSPKSDPDCVGPVTSGAPESLTINGIAWELAGSTLTQKSPAQGDTLVIGVVSDIKEDSDENKANLKQFADWFTKSKVDLIVVNGDTGETASQIENALAILAATKVPVFNIAGNRESRKEYKTGMRNLHAQFPTIFDLNRVRRVDLPQVDLVSLPGYFNANYIHADDGCQYFAADAAALTDIVKVANSPVVLVSHGGPKQDGAEALDRTSEGDNVGDPAITKALTDNKIPFGIFANIHEAGGRATDLSGRAAFKPGESLTSLYLNPGPADGVRWTMNDKTESVGMAALLTFKDGKAKYEVKRIAAEAKPIAKGTKKKAK